MGPYTMCGVWNVICFLLVDFVSHTPHVVFGVERCLRLNTTHFSGIWLIFHTCSYSMLAHIPLSEGRGVNQ